MPIWKLEPKNLTQRDWNASTYKNTVIVRAQDEKEARNLATQAFGIAVERQAGEPIPIIPWGQDWLVNCSRLEDSKYDEDGPATIIFPE